MKIIFWMQVITSVVVSALQLTSWFMGAHWNSDLATQNNVLFLIAGGFLWIHHAIVKQKVKP